MICVDVFVQHTIHQENTQYIIVNKEPKCLKEDLSSSLNFPHTATGMSFLEKHLYRWFGLVWFVLSNDTWSQ